MKTAPKKLKLPYLIATLFLCAAFAFCGGETKKIEVPNDPLDPFSSNFEVAFDSTYEGKMDTTNGGCGYHSVFYFWKEDFRVRIGYAPIFKNVMNKSLTLIIDTLHLTLPYSISNHEKTTQLMLSNPIDIKSIDRKLSALGLNRTKIHEGGRFLYYKDKNDREFEFRREVEISFREQIAIRELVFVNWNEAVIKAN